MTSKQIIDIRIRRQILVLRKQLNCNHEWVLYAGFKCLKCGFTTGGHKELNEKIENGL